MPVAELPVVADQSQTLDRLRTLIDDAEARWSGSLGGPAGQSGPVRDPVDSAAIKPAEVEADWDLALRRLTSRARSQFELERDLATRQVRPPVVAEVIARLRRSGLIDDGEFARAWVEQRRTAKGLSVAQLRRELLAKGVAPDLIDQVLTDLDDDIEVALTFGRRRARTLAAVEPGRFRARLAAQLERRGFATSVVRRVVNQIESERAADD